MISRTLAAGLLADAAGYPVITVTGSRQSGKTTLVRATFPDHGYVSLEEPDRRRFATEDPRGFLAGLPRRAILDEVQRVPELFSYLQVLVDGDPEPGRFVLSGSQNFLLMREITQTLAGRSAVRHLLPFSRSELERDTPRPLIRFDDLFENRSTGLELWPTVRTGFFPPVHDRGIPPEIWLPDYVRTYLERDVRSLVNVGDRLTFERFLALCAGRVGQLVNTSALASDCGIAVDTARRWLSVLTASFAVFLLRPHHTNFNKRVIKTPKLYFHDTGLACHLLGIRETAQLATHPLRGPLFENHVVAEIGKAYLHRRREPPLFFWRDRTGHEVDLLVEDGTTLHPVEIKSGQTVASDMLEGIRWWRRLAGDLAGAGTLVYGGDERQDRGGVAVRPWFSV